MSIREKEHQFYEENNHVSLRDYMEQDNCKIKVHKDLLGKDYQEMQIVDIINNFVKPGDLVATGRSKYSDVKMGVIVGFTNSYPRIAYFSKDYSTLEFTLGSPSILQSEFFIVKSKEIL